MSTSEKANAGTRADGASVARTMVAAEYAEARGSYHAVCYDKDGNIKWYDDIENLVTTVGKNDALDRYLSGSAYTAVWYMGLINLTSYVAGVVLADTMPTHGGWIEANTYSAVTRPAVSFAAASGGAKTTATPVSYDINGTVTVKGCFLATDNTKSGTAGILYSAGLFTGGDKAVTSGDTLNVTYTASL